MILIYKLRRRVIRSLENQWGATVNNIDVAILTKVNELMERYGVNPCDAVVTIRTPEHGPESVLAFEAPPPSKEAQQRFFQMLSDLRVSGGDQQIAGDDRDIYDQLQQAIQRAPRARPRR